MTTHIYLAADGERPVWRHARQESRRKPTPPSRWSRKRREDFDLLVQEVVRLGNAMAWMPVF